MVILSPFKSIFFLEWKGRVEYNDNVWKFVFKNRIEFFSVLAWIELPTLFPTLLCKNVRFPTLIYKTGVGTFSVYFFTIKGKKILRCFTPQKQKR